MDSSFSEEIGVDIIKVFPCEECNFLASSEEELKKHARQHVFTAVFGFIEDQTPANKALKKNMCCETKK